MCTDRPTAPQYNVWARPVSLMPAPENNGPCTVMSSPATCRPPPATTTAPLRAAGFSTAAGASTFTLPSAARVTEAVSPVPDTSTEQGTYITSVRSVAFGVQVPSTQASGETAV